MVLQYCTYHLAKLYLLTVYYMNPMAFKLHALIVIKAMRNNKTQQ